MTELKLEQPRRYWVRHKKTRLWESARGVYGYDEKSRVAVGFELLEYKTISAECIDIAIPCDELGWIDARTNQPPEIKDTVILVRSVDSDDVEYYHTAYYDCGWYDICGVRCNDFTHWQPVNERREA